MRLLVFLIYLSFTCGNSQLPYNVNSVPQQLKQKANAIVRVDNTEVLIHDYNRVTVLYKRAITSFNKIGDKVIWFGQFYRPETQIKKIEARVYDASGKEIKKYRKKDFKDMSASDGFSIYNDDRILWADYTPANYPYTFEIEVEYTDKNTAFLPRWTPLLDYHVSTEKTSFTISNPNNIPADYKMYRFEDFNISDVSVQDGVLKLQAENLPALPYEYYGSGFVNIAPQFIYTLKKFQLVNSLADNITDWKGFGLWQYNSLLKGRDALPAKTIQEITYLTADTQDTIEKIRRIYQYAQKKNRYISVQIGIGGWQPSTAEEVDRLSYGDCKGLTNYIKALLASQGITSYYTLVYAGEFITDIDTTLVSMQGNHVILTVPVGGKEYYLECTSSEVPFNYLGDFTDDRNIVKITPQGGIPGRTYKYEPEDNYTKTKATVTIGSDGSLAVQTVINSGGTPYKKRLFLESAVEKDVHLYYRNYWGYLHHMQFEEINHRNDKIKIDYSQELSFTTDNYAVKHGENLIITPNVLSRTENAPIRYANRRLPVKIQRGFYQTDEITLQIPEGYSVSSIPEPVLIQSPYGTYSAQIEKTTDQEYLYKRVLLIQDGLFPAEQYNDLRNFFREVVKNDQNKIILTKI